MKNQEIKVNVAGISGIEGVSLTTHDPNRSIDRIIAEVANTLIEESGTELSVRQALRLRAVAMLRTEMQRQGLKALMPPPQTADEAKQRIEDARGFIADNETYIAEVIADEVSVETGVAVSEMKSKYRSQRIAKARIKAWKILRDTYKLTNTKIGEVFKKDHSAVLHALGK